MKVVEQIVEILESKIKDTYEYSDYENPHFIVEIIDVIERYYPDIRENFDDLYNLADEFYGM